MNDPIHDLLQRDSLAEAEKITGKSYKDDEATMALGFLAHMHLNQQKEQALKATRDSYFNMPLDETLALYAELGFTEMLCDDFAGQAWDDEPAPEEAYRVLWHPDGILATVESYQAVLRNTTKIYYNVQFNPGVNRWEYTSSGQFVGADVWVGYHDAREGLRNTLDRFRSAGRFLSTWVERPFLWLLTYMDYYAEGYDHKAITAERISRLPAYVQAAIRGVS